MPTAAKQIKPANKPMPILARHAVSLAIVFVVSLVLSYFAWQFIHQQNQLNKLSSKDDTTFNEGLAYVILHAAESPSVMHDALYAVKDLPDLEHRADLLLAIAQSYSNLEEPADPIIPTTVTDEIAPLMQRLDPMQAIGLYDGLVQIKGIDPIHAAQSLLASIAPKDESKLLQVVDLLDTRLLWSRQWAPLDLWVRWLGVLAKSNSELTQAQTAKQLGELPEAVDNPRVADALALLASSPHDTVRNIVLHRCAGYATLAKDATDYEQIIFNLGNDANKIIARRAWMIVGHLNPLSGFAVNWQDADPFVAEAMLWAAIKTNPNRPEVAWSAYDKPLTQAMSLQALALLRDVESIRRIDAVIQPVPSEQIDIDPDRLIAYLTTGQPIEPHTINIACLSLSQHDQRARSASARLLRMNQPTARIIGAITAALVDAHPVLIGGVTAQVLRKHPDLTDEQLRSMTDDELSEFGLSRIDALPALLEAAQSAPPSANRSVEAKLLQLALWMRGDIGDDFTPAAEAMLLDDELPTSTVLMCLLQMRRPIAMDYLLGDLVTPRPNLRQLFIHERFWHVFRRFVDTSDLTLWLGGDPEAQGFQLEAMKQWYAVNRWNIQDGWWPEPATEN